VGGSSKIGDYLTFDIILVFEVLKARYKGKVLKLNVVEIVLHEQCNYEILANTIKTKHPPNREKKEQRERTQV
jgi:hypothetical protein